MKDLFFVTFIQYMSSYIEPNTRFCVYGLDNHFKRILNFDPFIPDRISHSRCKHGRNCHGAHSESNLKQSKFIREFFSDLKKNKINLGNINSEISRILKEGSIYNKRIRVSNAELSNMIVNRDNLNFVEKIQAYVKLCFWRSEQKKKGMNSLPNVRILNPKVKEDSIWALERITHTCKIHDNIKLMISKGEKIPRRITCRGGINCKLGAHNNYSLLNISDLLTGKSDDPMSKEEYDRIYAEFESYIIECKEEIKSSNEVLEKLNSFEKKNPRTVKRIYNINLKIDKMNRKIHYYNNEKKKINRQVHLTDYGIEPFCVHQEKLDQLKKDQEEKLEEVKQDVSSKARKIIKKKRR